MIIDRALTPTIPVINPIRFCATFPNMFSTSNFCSNIKLSSVRFDTIEGEGVKVKTGLRSVAFLLMFTGLVEDAKALEEEAWNKYKEIDTLSAEVERKKYEVSDLERKVDDLEASRHTAAADAASDSTAGNTAKRDADAARNIGDLDKEREQLQLSSQAFQRVTKLYNDCDRMTDEITKNKNAISQLEREIIQLERDISMLRADAIEKINEASRKRSQSVK